MRSGTMALTASKLRENIYRILDRVLETGIPVEVRRKGRTLRIEATDPPSRMARLKRRPYFLEDPEKIVHLDWSREWQP
jgi:hypothetical protein